MTEAQVTYSPYTQTFYRGSLEQSDFGARYASTYEPVAKLDLSRKWGDGRLEFTAEVARAAERNQYDAQTSSDVSVVTTTMMLTEVIGNQWRNFYAQNLFTRIPVPRLHLDVPVRSAKSAVHEKVPELNPPDLTQTVFTKATFALWKNVYHLYTSDEARLKANFDTLSYDIQQAAGALGKAANTQLVTAAETATGASKGSWGAKTSGVSDRDPAKDIMDEYTNIVNAYYTPRFLAMHPTIWGYYLSNTNVKGTAVPIVDRDMLGVFPLPGFPGLQAVVDPHFTATVAVLADPTTLLLGEGPTVAEQYRDPERGADAYVIRQYMQPLVGTADGSVKMTSVG